MLPAAESCGKILPSPNSSTGLRGKASHPHMSHGSQFSLLDQLEWQHQHHYNGYSGGCQGRSPFQSSCDDCKATEPPPLFSALHRYRGSKHPVKLQQLDLSADNTTDFSDIMRGGGSELRHLRYQQPHLGFDRLQLGHQNDSNDSSTKRNVSCPRHVNLENNELTLFRTRICERNRSGKCHNSDRCPHSHCQTWQRRNPTDYAYSSKLCPDIEFVKKGSKMTLVRRCGRGRGCEFAHSKEEELYHPTMYKTKMCNSHPSCTRYFCPFAHSAEELRRLPITTADQPRRVKGTECWKAEKEGRVTLDEKAHQIMPAHEKGGKQFSKRLDLPPGSPTSSSTTASSTTASPVLSTSAIFASRPMTSGVHPLFLNQPDDCEEEDHHYRRSHMMKRSATAEQAGVAHQKNNAERGLFDGRGCASFPQTNRGCTDDDLDTLLTGWTCNQDAMAAEGRTNHNVFWSPTKKRGGHGGLVPNFPHSPHHHHCLVSPKTTATNSYSSVRELCSEKSSDCLFFSRPTRAQQPTDRILVGDRTVHTNSNNELGITRSNEGDVGDFLIAAAAAAASYELPRSHSIFQQGDQMGEVNSQQVSNTGTAALLAALLQQQQNAYSESHLDARETESNNGLTNGCNQQATSRREDADCSLLFLTALSVIRSLDDNHSTTNMNSTDCSAAGAESLDATTLELFANSSSGNGVGDPDYDTQKNSLGRGERLPSSSTTNSGGEDSSTSSNSSVEGSSRAVRLSHLAV